VHGFTGANFGRLKLSYAVAAPNVSLDRNLMYFVRLLPHYSLPVDTGSILMFDRTTYIKHWLHVK